MQSARVVKQVDTRDLKSLGSESGHAGSSPAPGTSRAHGDARNDRTREAPQ